MQICDFLEWEIFQTKFGEKIKAHVLVSMPLFSENHAKYKKGGIMW
jgi:hypothetical protein